MVHLTKLLAVVLPAASGFDMNCYHVENPLGESNGEKGRSYRGLVSNTVSGRTCQKWTAVDPHAAPGDLTLEPDDGQVCGNGLGNHNYCMNPDLSMEKPWCYTLDPGMEKEACEIPECPAQERDFAQEAADLAAEIVSKDCNCAEQLYGGTETTEDTSVPLVTPALSQVSAHGKCACDGKKKSDPDCDCGSKD